MSSELTVVEGALSTPREYGAVTPVVAAAALKARRAAIRDVMNAVMVADLHYGVVPGTGGKPTLLKPGAEELCTAFGLTPRFMLIEASEDWTGEHHGGEPFIGYTSRCQLYRGEQLIAEGQGCCNSWESKYRYRKAERTCPKCGQSTIFRSKQDDQGWFCWKARGGCGAKYPVQAPEIVTQEVGRIANPDVADQANTLLKMSDKRALIAATLIATGASSMFTQDMADEETSAAHAHEAEQDAAPDWNDVNRQLAAAFGKHYADRHLVHYVAGAILQRVVRSMSDLTIHELEQVRAAFTSAPDQQRKEWKRYADKSRPTPEPEQEAAAEPADAFDEIPEHPLSRV